MYTVARNTVRNYWLLRKVATDGDTTTNSNPHEFFQDPVKWANWHAANNPNAFNAVAWGVPLLALGGLFGGWKGALGLGALGALGGWHKQNIAKWIADLNKTNNNSNTAGK